MSIFSSGKKKENKNVCKCNCGCCGSDTENIETGCSSDDETKKTSSISIKVLGTGCKSCHQQYENVIMAVKESSLDADVQYITDMKKIMEYGVMSMPAVVINEKTVVTGKVLKKDDVKALLDKIGAR